MTFAARQVSSGSKDQKGRAHLPFDPSLPPEAADIFVDSIVAFWRDEHAGVAAVQVLPQSAARALVLRAWRRDRHRIETVLEAYYEKTVPAPLRLGFSPIEKVVRKIVRGEP